MSFTFRWFWVWILILFIELFHLETIVNSPFNYGNVIAGVMWIIVTLVVGAVGLCLSKTDE